MPAGLRSREWALAIARSFLLGTQPCSPTAARPKSRLGVEIARFGRGVPGGLY